MFMLVILQESHNMDIEILLRKMSESSNVYIIQRMVKLTIVRAKLFYLFDIDESDDSGVSRTIWTPNFKQALAFVNEEEVEEIKASYSSLKPSVIVRVSKQELAER